MSRWLTLLLIAAMSVGCVRRSPNDPSYDPQAARKILVTALDAWQAGKAAELAQQHPAIRLADDDWRNGSRLVAYEVGEANGLFGPHKDVPVTLTLLDKRGQTVKKSVSYQITLSPGLAVLRTDS